MPLITFYPGLCLYPRIYGRKFHIHIRITLELCTLPDEAYRSFRNLTIRRRVIHYYTFYVFLTYFTFYSHREIYYEIVKHNIAYIIVNHFVSEDRTETSTEYISLSLHVKNRMNRHLNILLSVVMFKN